VGDPEGSELEEAEADRSNNPLPLLFRPNFALSAETGRRSAGSFTAMVSLGLRVGVPNPRRGWGWVLWRAGYAASRGCGVITVIVTIGLHGIVIAGGVVGEQG